jgi:outer membrane protein TolC
MKQLKKWLNMFRNVSTRFKIIYTCLLCCSLSALNAQQVLTIEQAIGTALQNNYNILLAKNDSMAAALDVSYTYAAFLPRLNAGAGATWNKNNQRQNFADGSKREQNGVRSNNINSSLNLNWVLFDGLKMFITRDKIEEFAALGELAVKQQVINTVANVITTYYDIVRQKQQLRAYEEQYSVTDAQVKLSQRKLEIGVGAKPDVLQGKVDLNALKSNQLRQLTLIDQLKDDLNQLMNVSPLATYLVSDSIPLDTQILLGDVVSGAELQNAGSTPSSTSGCSARSSRTRARSSGSTAWARRSSRA